MRPHLYNRACPSVGRLRSRPNRSIEKEKKQIKKMEWSGGFNGAIEKKKDTNSLSFPLYLVYNLF